MSHLSSNYKKYLNLKDIKRKTFAKNEHKKYQSQTKSKKTNAFRIKTMHLMSNIINKFKCK